MLLYVVMRGPQSDGYLGCDHECVAPLMRISKLGRKRGKRLRGLLVIPVIEFKITIVWRCRFVWDSECLRKRVTKTLIAVRFGASRNVRSRRSRWCTYERQTRTMLYNA
jgi:hypothetical protein